MINIILAFQVITIFDTLELGIKVRTIGIIKLTVNIKTNQIVIA